MYERVDKLKENKSRAVANSVAWKNSDLKQGFQFIDNRPEVAAQMKMQSLLNDSSSQSVQKKANNTGLPNNLKLGIENLSGYSMDDVKVHRNSDKPAQLQAHAYAQGTDIHLGAGQEKHLTHEAWHVVQQKQGRVKPTMQMKGKVNINDDVGLEKEADEMGEKALQRVSNNDGRQRGKSITPSPLIQLQNAIVVQANFGNWIASLCRNLCSCFKKKKDADSFEEELINSNPREVEEIKEQEPTVAELIKKGTYTYSKTNMKLLPLITKNLQFYTPHDVGFLGEKAPMFTTKDPKVKVNIAGMLTCSAAKVVFGDGTNGFVHVMSSTVDDLKKKIQNDSRNANDVTQVTWWQTLQNGEYTKDKDGEKDDITLKPQMKKLLEDTKTELEDTFKHAQVKIYLNGYGSIQLTTDDTVFSIP